MQLRIRLLLFWGEGGLVLRAGFGPFRFSLYPRRKEKPKKAGKRADRKSRSKQKEKPKDEEPATGGRLDLMLDLLSVALELAGRFRKKLLISEIFIRLHWGAGDPADAAIGYGAANAALGAILSRLEASFRVRKTDTLVRLDYSLEKPEVFLRANLSISLMQALSLGLFAGQKALGAYMRYQKTKKSEGTVRKAVR